MERPSNSVPGSKPERRELKRENIELRSIEYVPCKDFSTILGKFFRCFLTIYFPPVTPRSGAISGVMILPASKILGYSHAAPPA